LAVALTAALSIQNAEAQGGPPAMPVTVAEPLSRHVTQWDEFSGRFEAVESVEVRARVSGFIEKVLFQDGQKVAAGDPLFIIDRRPYEIAVDSARAEVARAAATVELNEGELERGARLVKSRNIPEREYDQRKANLNVARAQLQSAQAGLKNAELNLEWTEVRAPIAGRVSDKRVNAGNLVTGGQSGTTLLTTIVSLDPIHFVFDISEADYLRYTRLLLAGSRPSSRDGSTQVRMKLADQTSWDLSGRLNFVDNEINARSGTLRVRALVDNKNDLLTPGIFARVQLFGGEFDAMLIPDTAVVSDQARKIVFVVDADGVVGVRPVTLGQIIDGLRVVREGLKSSDQIVIDGLANPMVRPGAKVVPQKGTIVAKTT
jgi:membrane fusion protein, multidrug efflux system